MMDLCSLFLVFRLGFMYLNCYWGWELSASSGLHTGRTPASGSRSRFSTPKPPSHTRASNVFVERFGCCYVFRVFILLGCMNC